MSLPIGGLLLGLGRAVLVGLAVGYLAPASTWAADPPAARVIADRDAEQGAIDVERRQVEASQDRAKLACQGRLLLTQCLDEARGTWRLPQDKLQRRQLAQGDADRRERAAQRLQALQARAHLLTQAAAAYGAASTPTRRSRAVRLVGREVGSAPAAPALPAAVTATGTGARASAQAASAQAQALRNQVAYWRRQQQASGHRAAVLERNWRQDASKPPAAGLPVPAAAPVSY
jgi:colicin import membrane protein